MLTFIGKISYHADTDSFTIRDNVGFIGGGAKEALVVLKERYMDWMSGSKLCFGIGACLFGVAAAWEWLRRSQRANQEFLRRHLAEMAERTKFNEVSSNLGKCFSECVICMSAAATVVLVPCNHLVLCITCYRTMQKNRPKVACPLCRH
jgi:hypothetical protein